MRAPYGIPLSQIAFEPSRALEGYEVLAANIAQQGGLLHPVILRVTGDHYTIVEGARRLQALRWLGKTQVSARFVAGQLPEVALLSLLENKERLGIDPFTEAEAIERCRSTYGLTISHIAKWTDLSERSLLDAVALLVRARPALLQAVHDGWLTPGQASRLAELSQTRQRLFLNRIVTGRGEVFDGKGYRPMHRSNQGHHGRPQF